MTDIEYASLSSRLAPEPEVICVFEQVLEHEHIYLEALPSAQMYERSYMHRDVVTHVETAQEQDFVITGSADGHLKFWKKKGEGIEFAKHFRAHVEAIAGSVAFHCKKLHFASGQGAATRLPGCCTFRRACLRVGVPHALYRVGMHQPASFDARTSGHVEPCSPLPHRPFS